jgi:hypothetical protein
MVRGFINGQAAGHTNSDSVLSKHDGLEHCSSEDNCVQLAYEQLILYSY